MTQRLGIFGGTFDPVHRGHIHAGQQILAELELEQLFLVPAHQPVHRDRPMASSAQRLEMLELACREHRGLVIDAREIEREGPSYSLLTIKEHREREPNACLYFVMGTDAVSQFHHWYQYEAFLDYVNLVILPRPDFGLDLSTETERAFKGHWQTELGQFKASLAGQVYVSEQAMLTQSATDVRLALGNEETAHEMLPDQVYDYIQDHKLYGKDLIE